MLVDCIATSLTHISHRVTSATCPSHLYRRSCWRWFFVSGCSISYGWSGQCSGSGVYSSNGGTWEHVPLASPQKYGWLQYMLGAVADLADTRDILFCILCFQVAQGFACPPQPKILPLLPQKYGWLFAWCRCSGRFGKHKGHSLFYSLFLSCPKAVANAEEVWESRGHFFGTELGLLWPTPIGSLL